MRFSTIFAASAFAGAAFAEDHIIGVGTKDGEIVFNPNNITAAEGDNIHFKFWPKNHSIAQSTFQRPCQPMRNGLWSGFVPTSDTEKASETEFHYTVTNASQPIWLYCSQGQHCQNGMVAVINPPSSGPNTIDAFITAAGRASDNVSPTSTEPIGGNLTESSNSTGTEEEDPEETGAASTLHPNTFAVTGVLGVFAYFLL